MESKAPLVLISEVAPSSESLADSKTHKEKDRNHLQVTRLFQGKESLLSSQISLFVQQTKQKIPDGGWGWFVVLASFLINMFSDGLGFTFGLIYVEFLEEFKASKSATSWIGSLYLAIPLIAGPIGSSMVDKYGCKYMTILGGCICALGFVLSSYVTSIGLMYVTFGVVGGLGQGLCYITAVVSIAFWFEKRRTLALGLAASGTGFGTFCFSPLSTFLIAEYGWRGTLLINAGFLANFCVCGMLMRDPDWLVEDYVGSKKFENTKERVSAENNDKTDFKNDQYFVQNIDTSLDLTEKDRFMSVINLPTFLKQNEKVPLEVLKLLSENPQFYSVVLENYPNLLSCKSTSEKGLNAISATDLHNSTIPLKFSMKLKKTDLEIEANPLDNLEKHLGKSIPHSYLKNIRFRKNSMGYRGAMLNIHKYKLKASSCPNFFKNSIETLNLEEDEKWYNAIVDALKDMSHVSLFFEVHFFLLSLSTIILCIWFIVPYFYLAEHMTSFGYTEHQASFALSSIGLANTVGMVILGWAGDRVDIPKTYTACLIFCGISVILIMYFTHNYIMLVLSSSLFGLFFASCLTLTPSLLAQLVPLEDFTMAYGLFLLCQGIGNLIGPPLAGFLYDLTQSWKMSFYQAGFWIVISGLLIALIPVTENRNILKNKNLRRNSVYEANTKIVV